MPDAIETLGRTSKQIVNTHPKINALCVCIFSPEVSDYDELVRVKEKRADWTEHDEDLLRTWVLAQRQIYISDPADEFKCDRRREHSHSCLPVGKHGYVIVLASKSPTAPMLSDELRIESLKLADAVLAAIGAMEHG